MLHLEKWRLKPLDHQVVGVERQVEEPAFALFDEMGLGKSYQVIMTACELFIRGKVDLVMIVCPASAVRAVWADRVMGEITAHTWVPYVTYVYNSKGLLKLHESQPQSPRLAFVVTNYECIRKVTKVKRRRTYPRVDHLGKLVKGRKVQLVVDESSYVAYPDSAQTRATYALRQHADRVVILNGTPYANNVGSFYPQYKMLDAKILGVPTFTEYRRKYCAVDIWNNPRGWLNDEVEQDFIRRTAPYTLRRTKNECLDLPPKLYTRREVALSKETWRLYTEMRDNMIAWLDDERAATAAQAVVKIVRLTQLTSGIIGGIEGEENYIHSSEKTDFVIDLIKAEITQQPKIIVWSQFRLERADLYKRLREKGITSYQIYGGQKDTERHEAIRIFSDVNSTEPAVLLAQPRAGGIGLNLVTSALAIYISNGYSHVARLQSEDRIHRMGQRRPCSILDVLAVGPAGQKTWDHAVLKALTDKDDMEKWTTDLWKKALLAA